MNLDMMRGAFLILCCGASLGLVILLCERGIRVKIPEETPESWKIHAGRRNAITGYEINSYAAFGKIREENSTVVTVVRRKNQQFTIN